MINHFKKLLLGSSIIIFGLLLFYNRLMVDNSIRVTVSSISNTILLSTNVRTTADNMTTTIVGLHVILTFPVFPYNVTTNQSASYMRMMEYKHCLTKYLNNHFVKQVNVLYNSSDMPKFIQSNIDPHPKLHLQPVNSPEVALTLHQFAFTHIQGEVVAITQGDIILGEGVEMINKTTLVKHRIMYSLSRHESPCARMTDMCKKYMGSHDMFIFVPEGNITQKGVKHLSHTINSWGTENVVMYVYSKILHYKLLNPCRSIKIYHHHCSSFRPNFTERKRVNVRGISAQSGPTDKLF